MANGDVRPSRRERKRRETAIRIEAVALELFRERGFEATTVDDIAEAADVGRATVFRYFGTKDDIVYAIEPELLEFICGLIRQTPHVGLDEIVIRYAEHVDGNVPDLRDRAALIATTPRLIERFANVRSRWDRAIAAEVACVRSDGATSTFEDRIAASVAVSALFNAFLRWASSPDASLASLVRRGIAAVPRAFDVTGDPGPSAPEAGLAAPPDLADSSRGAAALPSLDQIDHKYSITFDGPPARVSAECSCGWRGRPAISAGLAGAEWDQHLLEASGAEADQHARS